MSYQILISLSFLLALVGIVLNINNFFGEATIYITISAIVIAALILKHAIDKYTIDYSTKDNLVQNKLEEVSKLLNAISVTADNNNVALIAKLDKDNQADQTKFEDLQREMAIVNNIVNLVNSNVENSNNALIAKLDKDNQADQTKFEDLQREIAIVNNTVNLVNSNVENSNNALIAKLDKDNQVEQARFEDIQQGIVITKEDINKSLEHIELKILELDKHKEYLENLIINTEKIYGGINDIKDGISKLNKLIIEKTEDIQEEFLYRFESKLSDIHDDLQKNGKRNRESIFELMEDVEKLKNLIEKYQSEISSLNDILGKTIDSMKNEREYNDQLLTQYMDLTMKDNEIISNILKK